MLATPFVSIIYVNYNTADLLINSIESVQRNCTRVSFEIIIVDNASNKNEVYKIKQWQKASTNQIQTIFSERNLGFGKANNLAVKYASGRYLFFLNPDTLIINDAIEIFYNFLESSDQDIVACGGNLLKPDLTPNDSYGNFPGFLLELCNVGVGLRYLFNNHYRKNVAIASEVQSDSLVKVPYIVGADIFIRSNQFNAISGFDDSYFMYYEDTDLFYRLASRGYKAYLLPQAKIIHFEGAAIGESRKQFNLKKFEILLKSKLHYFRKWYPGYLIPVLKLIIVLQILVQSAKGKMGKDLKIVFGAYVKATRLSDSKTGDG